MMRAAPAGGDGTGKNPTDRAKLGWKWSLAADANGVPIGWAIDGANRNDCKLVEPTLQAIAARGLLVDVETIHLDRGYDHDFVRDLIDDAGIDDAVIARRRQRDEPKRAAGLRLGPRWTVERTNGVTPPQARQSRALHWPSHPPIQGDYVALLQTCPFSCGALPTMPHRNPPRAVHTG